MFNYIDNPTIIPSYFFIEKELDCKKSTLCCIFVIIKIHL